MPRGVHPFALASALATVAILIVVVGIVSYLSRAIDWRSVTMAPGAGDHDPGVVRIEADLRRQAEVMAVLTARVEKLEERIGEFAAELRFARQPVEAMREPASGAGDRASEASPRLQAAASWLERLLPARFAGLTPEEAEHLRDLDLSGTQVTDEDLEHLDVFPSLRSLSLRGTAVTDAGLAHLQGLDLLRSLELRGAVIAGSGLAHLPPSLEELDLTDTGVSTDGLHHLPRLPVLRTLDLNRAAMDDGAIEVLGRWPSLRKIELDGTGITDEGLRRLLELNPALERLELRGAGTTAAAVREISETFPGLTIVKETFPGG